MSDLIAAFPPPPVYYKLFKNEFSLVPPSPPADPSEFISFNETYSTIQKINALSTGPFCSLLSSNVNQILSSYISLIEATSESSQETISSLVSQINESFLRMHEQINEQRKVEALYKVIELWKARIDRKRQMISEINEKMWVEAEDVLANCQVYTKKTPVPCNFTEFIMNRLQN